VSVWKKRVPGKGKITYKGSEGGANMACWKRQGGWNKVKKCLRVCARGEGGIIKSYRNLQVSGRILDFILGDMGSGMWGILSG